MFRVFFHCNILQFLIFSCLLQGFSKNTFLRNYVYEKIIPPHPTHLISRRLQVQLRILGMTSWTKYVINISRWTVTSKGPSQYTILRFLIVNANFPLFIQSVQDILIKMICVFFYCNILWFFIEFLIFYCFIQGFSKNTGATCYKSSSPYLTMQLLTNLIESRKEITFILA